MIALVLIAPSAALDYESLALNYANLNSESVAAAASGTALAYTKSCGQGEVKKLLHGPQCLLSQLPTARA